MRDIVSPLDGIVSPFGARRGTFSPASWFTAGALGAWYSPRPAVLYQDAAGTTAVAAAADPAGLQLDESNGLVLGTELVTNGDFATGDFTGFTTGGGWAVSGNEATLNSNNSAFYLRPTVSTTNWRVLRFTLTRVTSGSLDVRGNNPAYAVIAAAFSSAGTYTVYIPPGQEINFLRNSVTFNGAIDNISVKEILGNHAVLSGANTLRPLYQITPQRLAFDATDDRLLTALNPTASGSIAVRIKGGTASRVAIGSQGSSNGRAFVGLAADGSLGAGIGADSTSTIKGTADIRTAWATGVVTWNGTTVNLYQDGALVYTGAQNGAVNTTVPFMLGCLNNNATAAAFWDGSIGAAIVLNRVMTLSEIVSLNTYWSTIQ